MLTLTKDFRNNPLSYKLGNLKFITFLRNDNWIVNQYEYQPSGTHLKLDLETALKVREHRIQFLILFKIAFFHVWKYFCGSTFFFDLPFSLHLIQGPARCNQQIKTINLSQPHISKSRHNLLVFLFTLIIACYILSSRFIYNFI